MMKIQATGESKYILLARGKTCKNGNAHQFYPLILALSIIIIILEATWENGNFWGWLAMQSFTIFLNSLSYLPLSSANPLVNSKMEMELNTSNQM